jgi:hypothetical protein
MVIKSVICTSSTAARMDIDRRWNRCDQPRQLRLDPVDGFDDVGAGLLEDDQEHAALAVGPGGLLHVLGPGDRLADVADPQRTAVAVGDDDVVPVLGVQQLVVGVDRVGAFLPVDIALGAVDRGDRDLAAHVFQRQALGHQFRRIDLDADRGLLLASDEDLRHARYLADLLTELGVDRVTHLDQRQRVRGRRQQQHRRVGRVDLAIGRRRRQVLRQLPAGGVDRRLDVVGGAVDAAVEVELDRHRGGAQRTRRSHLGDAGNLRELPLQRLRDRGSHGFGTAARQRCRDLDGREIDLRQRRDRKQRIGDHADEQNARHHQRGADRVSDEKRRDAFVHVLRPGKAAGASFPRRWGITPARTPGAIVRFPRLRSVAPESGIREQPAGRQHKRTGRCSAIGNLRGPMRPSSYRRVGHRIPIRQRGRRLTARPIELPGNAGLI